MRSREIFCRSPQFFLVMPSVLSRASAERWAASGVWKVREEPDWTPARWNRPLAFGVASRHEVFEPPPDCPKIITREGSPPNAEMLSRTHSREATMSITPATPAYLNSGGAPAIEPRWV